LHEGLTSALKRWRGYVFVKVGLDYAPTISLADGAFVLFFGADYVDFIVVLGGVVPVCHRSRT
jgi:hypothetical protein